ncbi:MAG: peptidoglycan DD-metalloendopeptidase family protein [Alphaproteobacteria bacterium]|nr:peptidoglycan DD-metalloendopeptidase family protein [Alphaproteobacteria bacterium]MCL2890009.1 peptidoglycan DD-metalloendopeptidase family protein [Alphaproteobacteria bacterium]
MQKLFMILPVVIAVCMATADAHANRSELANVQAQLRRQEAAAKQKDAEVKKSDANVARTQKDLVATAGKVSKLESERGTISDRIAELDKRRTQLTAQIAANRTRMGDSAGALLAISATPPMATDDAREYVLTAALLTGVADQFDAEMRVAVEQIAELEKVIEQRRARQVELDRTAKRYNTQRAELDKLLRNRTAQNEKLRAEQFAANARLRELSARAKNLAELMTGVGSSAMSADTSFSARKLNPPVNGRLVSTFAEKSALGIISDGWRIRTRGDALVTAPADGEIKFADSFRGYSRVLIISHKNGYNSVMTGMATTDVLVGQEVLAGEPVGRMPAAARDGGRPEMYLEVRRGPNAVNPARLFNEPQ